MTYVVSICIPTFNRCSELEATLESIVLQDGFRDDIEIIVIDNDSPDLTESVVRRIAEDHPNISYQKNSVNVGPTENVLRAVCAGTGRYVKLLNDNKVLNDGVLSAWRLLYSEADEDVIFHYPHRISIGRDTSTVVNTDQFAKALRHYLTWLGGISLKREALDRVDFASVDRESHIPQTELMFKVLGPGPARIVYSDWFVQRTQPVRSGYNYFKVFNVNFPRILDQAQAAGSISRGTKRQVERSLLRHHTFPFILSSVIDRDHYELRRDDAFSYLFHRYYSFPELYLFPVWAAWHGAKAAILKRKTTAP